MLLEIYSLSFGCSSFWCRGYRLVSEYVPSFPGISHSALNGTWTADPKGLWLMQDMTVVRYLMCQYKPKINIGWALGDSIQRSTGLEHKGLLYPLWTRWGTYLGCCSQEGRSSELRLKRGVRQAAHTLNNPQVDCTGVLLCVIRK